VQGERGIMSVLFCRWADDTVVEEEEDKDEVAGVEIIKDPRSGSKEPPSSESENSTVKNTDENGGTTGSEIVEPEGEREQEPGTPVDELKVKDCLRAPGMVFSLWKDQEVEWEESEVDENSSDEEDRPKFFSFNDAQEKHEGECINKLKESKDVAAVGTSEKYESDTESDFSVNDLVIQKIETSSQIKIEPASSTTEEFKDTEKNIAESKFKTTFMRKSSAPRKSKAKKVTSSRVSNKSSKTPNKKSNIQRQLSKVMKVTPEQDKRRKSSGKASHKASEASVHTTRTRRSKSNPESNYGKRIPVEEIQTKIVLDEVKLETHENDEAEMCNLITDAIEFEENITQFKTEQSEVVDCEEDEDYEYTSLGDPLGDPLSTEICSSATARPFLWPKLDPLFHTVTEFKLSQEFAKLIKALQKPTAKIQPLVRPPEPGPGLGLGTKTEIQEAVESPGQARTRKRKALQGAASSELKSLLSPSSVHPSAVILPSRRRSDKQEERKVEEEEVEIKRRKRKRAGPSGLKKKGADSATVGKKAGNKSKARADVSIVATVPAPEPEPGYYQVVCKTGSYQCPLCSTRWSLNQTYGRHVVSMTCQVEQSKESLVSAPWILAGGDQDEDVAILTENISPLNNIFVSVNPATPRKDSYVTTSHVPSLTLLCRGVLPTPATPIRVKEGLEYYHALVWPDNNKEEVVFKYMCRLAKMTMVTSVKEYERLCREPLKVALYLEKKIGKSRDSVGYRHSQTRRWVEKYTLYLTLPLHDIFLVVSQAGYRVLEFPLAEGRVGLLCLVCPTMSCKGCVANQAPKQPTWQPGKKLPLKVTVRTMPKDKKSSKKSLDETLKNSKSLPGLCVSEPKLPPLQLHICSPCKTVFNTRQALTEHRGGCNKGESRQ